MQHSMFLPKYKSNLLVKRAFFKFSLFIFCMIGPQKSFILHLQHAKDIILSILIINNTKYGILCTNLKICLPMTFIGNKTESNWKQLCRVHQQASRLSWVWLSASGATGYMPGLYFSVYTARTMAGYSEVQMFTHWAACVILHTPYKHAVPLPLANVWSHISMPSSSHCSSPYILCH